MIGEKISHYRILDKIGEGGMGAVYKAEDLRLRRIVALKILPRQLTRSEEAKERFIQEARAASALDHPNICTIHEFDQTPDGRLFFAMTLYEGDTLERVIRQRTLTLPAMLDIIIQIAEGLAAAHAKGITHRDIKPANIILTRENRVKILDFGLAKLTGITDPASDDATSGTIAYMSPEQAGGKKVDDRTDIWSTAVILYEMLTGRRPFAGQFRQSIIYSILNEHPPRLDAVGEFTSARLQHILDRALAKAPDQRYPHILEFIDDLKKLRDSGQPAEVAEIPAVRKKLLLPALIIFFAVVVLSVWQFFSRPPQPVNTITVLPFDDQHTDYLGKGIARDLLTTLARIEGLTVVVPSPSDSRQLKDRLNTHYVIRGSVEQVEPRIRVKAQLLSLPGETELWTGTFETPWSRIKTIEAAISDRTESVLGLRSGSVPDTGQSAVQRVDPQAFEYYLKGREYYYRYRDRDNETAIALFRKSIGADPLFAPALAGLADAFAQKTLRYGRDAAWLDSSAHAARKALVIDPKTSEAYKALALVAYTGSRFRQSCELNRAALKNDPAYSPAMANLGWGYLQLGVVDSAEYWLTKALAHNPTNPAITMGKGLSDLCTGAYAQAERFLQKTLDLDPDYHPSPVVLLTMVGLITQGPEKTLNDIQPLMERFPAVPEINFAAGDAALQAGNPGLAAGYYQKVFEEDPQAWHPFTGINVTTALGFILHKKEYHKQAEEMFSLSMHMDRQNIDRGNEWWGVSYDMAALFTVQGEDSLAFVWLNDAFEKGFVLTAWLEIDPLFEGLRGDARFGHLVGD